ncbi:phage portal protein family protein [Pseudomonas aeruginosa]|uniref:phage portal protein family protein n=1 Tax=Pseudomonas aeruginosa TaxID=287 RepID=UPI003D701C1C
MPLLVFHHRPQSWPFQLNPEDQNELVAARQQPRRRSLAQLLGWDHSPAACAPGAWPCNGLFRVLAWPYLFRHYATSDLAEMLEIYGLPIRPGKYPPGTAADEEKG